MMAGSVLCTSCQTAAPAKPIAEFAEIWQTDSSSHSYVEAFDAIIFLCSERHTYIRELLQTELQIPLELDVQKERVLSPWIYMAGKPVSTSGFSLDYTQTPYAEDIADGYFDDVFIFLLSEEANSEHCSIVEYSFGTTDSPVIDWLEEHSLPSALLR